MPIYHSVKLSLVYYKNFDDKIALVQTFKTNDADTAVDAFKVGFREK